MKFTKKLNYLSNQWYNDGLKKANIRDLSGAITSLKKSLQYNRDNIAARNLLGLCYYGRGEVVEALVEWVISKNIKTHGNIANYFIKKVQESQNELEIINQAVKKYNQAVAYCQQGGEDLAAIQLKKVISAHPTFLKAYQLLALLYIHTEQYAKARQLIRKAHKLDTTNELTLRYMHELKKIHKENAANERNEKKNAISYTLGNETIIQPVSSTLKDNATIMTILNIIIGLAVGAAVVWFLVVPTLKQELATKHNQEIISYSEQISALQSELDKVEKDLDVYVEQSEETETAQKVAGSTKSSYEALVSIFSQYSSGEYDLSALVDEMMTMNIESLGENGKALYEELSKTLIEEESKKYYDEAYKSFRASAIQTAEEKLSRVMEINESYGEGKALLLQLRIYNLQGNAEKAEEAYDKLLELFPNSEAVKEAAELMNKTTE